MSTRVNAVIAAISAILLHFSFNRYFSLVEFCIIYFLILITLQTIDIKSKLK